MQLVIRRRQEQARGVLGGNKGVHFTLFCRLELNSDELDLVNRYKLSEHPVTYGTYQGQRVPRDTVGGLMKGVVQTIQDVTTLVENERVIKEACDELPVLFEICRSFGGEEVVTYPRRTIAADLRDSEASSLPAMRE